MCSLIDSYYEKCSRSVVQKHNYDYHAYEYLITDFNLLCSIDIIMSAKCA